MNAQDLMNSILQLAVQGKLVGQREEEGTAKELLERIEVDKKKLIKEGKIKKQKSLPAIKEDEIPFDIPESWEWVRINDLADSCEVPFADGPFGSNLKSEHYILEPEVRIIQLSNIGENGWKNKNIKYTSHRHAETIKRSKVNIGEIVIAKMMPAGRAIEVPNIDSNYVLSSDAVKFVPHPFLDKKYLLNAINSSMFRSQIYAEVQGITRVRTSLTKLKTYLISLPPLEEQKRIVAKIEELKPYVGKYDAAYSEVEELNKKFPEDMQKSILQYAIQGKLVKQQEEEGTAEELYKQIQEEKKKLIKEGMIKNTNAFPEISEDEIPFDIPESWKWLRIGDLTYNFGQKKPDKLFDYIDVGSIDNINGTLGKEMNLIEPKEAPSRARKIVKEGTVLYSTVRPYLLNICIIDKEFEHEPIASTAFAVLHPINGVYNKYLYYVLKSPMFVSYVNSVMIGVAYPAINDTNLLAGLIPLPPFTEQKRIVEKIEKLLPYTKQMIK